MSRSYDEVATELAARVRGDTGRPVRLVNEIVEDIADTLCDFAAMRPLGLEIDGTMRPETLPLVAELLLELAASLSRAGGWPWTPLPHDPEFRDVWTDAKGNVAGMYGRGTQT